VIASLGRSNNDAVNIGLLILATVIAEGRFGR
jgi:hypothetical protein